MITLSKNTAGQSFHVTPFEARKYLDSFTHYLMVLTKNSTNKDFALILNLATDNARYTKVDINTNIDDAINGDVLISDSGLYTYTIYGQNSATNLDTANTVGVCELGVCRVVADEAWTVPTISMPDNVVYYE